MKKKLALLMSALMVVGMIPATAFAVTTNTIDRIVTASEETVLGDTVSAPVFKMADKNLEDLQDEEIAFKVTLENAEWAIDNGGDDLAVGDGAITWTTAKAQGDDNSSTGTAKNYDVKVQLLSASQIIVTVEDYYGASTVDCYIQIPMEAELTDNGEASLTVDPMDSVITAGTYKFANVVDGDTVATISDTSSIQEGGTTIETITIEENSAGSLDTTGTLKLKLTSGFMWDDAVESDYGDIYSSYPSGFAITDATVDEEELLLDYEINSGSGVSKALTITLTGLEVYFDEDDVSIGDICEVTISGGGMTKTTLEVGTAVDYGIKFSVEDDTLPVLYSGRRDTDEDTLEVTFKETVKNSWLYNRTTKIIFPDGVKIIDVDVDEDNVTDFDYSIEDNEMKLEATGTSGKVELNFTFQLSVAPDFTGDITATLTGAGIDEDQEVVVATAEAPITVEADSNAVSIDYRNVAIGDITITEAYAGALEKDKVLYLELDSIAFDGTPSVEVVEGDIEVGDVDVEDGLLTIEIDSESAKTPGVLKVTDIELYLDRSLPAGNYELSLVAVDDDLPDVDDSDFTSGENYDGYAETDNAYFYNAAAKGSDFSGSTAFDCRKVVVKSNYVEVVTAGRDQDDSTFTTQIKVTIGSNVMYAGETEIELDVPAYISNGYTMLPVRAVTEALSGSAIVRWDDSTKTVTITFGSRVISMAVGSSSMNINGVPVQMQAAMEITNDRAFIPLRDLGYALGLNDSKIAWDDTTKTATLN